MYPPFENSFPVWQGFWAIFPCQGVNPARLGFLPLPVSTIFPSQSLGGESPTSKLTILPLQLRVSFWTVKSNGPLESEIQPSILPELSPRTGNNLTQILRLQDSVR